MLPDDLRELLWLYARRGVADWKNAPAVLRRRATKCLGSEIADNETEAAETLGTVYNGGNASQLRFIPMPHSGNPGFDRSFFIPICESGPDGVRVAFDLFMIVNASRMNCLAYRYEPAPSYTSTHNYGHVQMSRKLLRRTIAAATLEWIPERYPAHPIGTSDPLGMFLSMTTAVHGYHGGILEVIQRVFSEASRAREAARYVGELKKLLAA